MSALQQPGGNEQCVQCAMSFTVIQCHPMSTNVIQCHPMSLCAIQCHPIGNWFWCFHFDFFLVGYRVIKKSNLCIISGNLRILRRENNTTSKYQLKIWKTRKNHNSVSHFMNWTRYALRKCQIIFHLQESPFIILSKSFSLQIFSFVPEQMMEQMMDLESPPIAENLGNFKRNLSFKEMSSFSQLYSSWICLGLSFWKSKKIHIRILSYS